MRNKLTEELAVCGLNAVLALGEYHPDTINRLFLRTDRLKTFSGVCRRLAQQKRPYKLCEDEELERICKTVHHQGVAAMIDEPVVAPLSLEELDFWADGGKTGLVLHSVENDHNLGAIARAAAFFDVHFVVLNENDSEARLTTSAYRVAEGAMEHLTVRKVGNTAAFLKDASKRLLVLGTDTRARQRVGDLGGIVKARRGRPGIALVLGNEETGLPQPVKDCCSCLLRIPGTGNIESLNVSQATALFLYHLFEL
ncbi:MAG: RNA methyltransferase [Treponema sp.]|jgi:TrmH RNA methyltransferase|nr:RNA methyltransferase [Treponema sp.]